MVTNNSKGVEKSGLCKLCEDKEHALLECIYVRESWLDIQN